MVTTNYITTTKSKKIEIIILNNYVKISIWIYVIFKDRFIVKVPQLAFSCFSLVSKRKYKAQKFNIIFLKFKRFSIMKRRTTPFFVHVFLWNSLQNVYLPIILVISFLFPPSIKNFVVHKSQSTTLANECVNRSGQAYSCEHEKILKHIPCHVMEYF